MSNSALSNAAQTPEPHRASVPRGLAVAVSALALLAALAQPDPVSAQDTLFVDTGRVGIGTSTPEEELHLSGIGGDTQLLVEEASGTAAARTLFALRNNGGIRFGLFNTQNGSIWQFNALANFNIDYNGSPGNEMQVKTNGDVVITGDYFSTTCPSPTPCAPDYVFEPGYELLPLSELEDFVRANKHLPNIPSAEELTGPVNISKLQMGLLEKIEELTLYTIAQQEAIDGLQGEIVRRDDRIRELESKHEALSERVEALLRVEGAMP